MRTSEQKRGDTTPEGTRRPSPPTKSRSPLRTASGRLASTNLEGPQVSISMVQHSVVVSDRPPNTSLTPTPRADAMIPRQESQDSRGIPNTSPQCSLSTSRISPGPAAKRSRETSPGVGPGPRAKVAAGATQRVNPGARLGAVLEVAAETSKETKSGAGQESQDRSATAMSLETNLGARSGYQSNKGAGPSRKTKADTQSRPKSAGAGPRSSRVSAKSGIEGAGPRLTPYYFALSREVVALERRIRNQQHPESLGLASASSSSSSASSLDSAPFSDPMLLALLSRTALKAVHHRLSQRAPKPSRGQSTSETETEAPQTTTNPIGQQLSSTNPLLTLHQLYSNLRILLHAPLNTITPETSSLIQQYLYALQELEDRAPASTQAYRALSDEETDEIRVPQLTGERASPPQDPQPALSWLPTALYVQNQLSALQTISARSGASKPMISVLHGYFANTQIPSFALVEILCGLD